MSDEPQSKIIARSLN